MTRVAVDANILVYATGFAFGDSDSSKVEASRRLLDRLEEPGLLLSTQALAELHFVLVRKARMTSDAAAAIVDRWREAAEVVGVNEDTVAAALALASTHRLQIFDAIILSSVAGHADLLLSEDMQDGFEWKGVTVRNPFAGHIEF